MSEKDLKVEGTDLSPDRTVGFVKIVELGKAQQVTVRTALMAKVTKFLAQLEKMGFEYVTVTVQKDKPLILGGKNIGIGIAPCYEEE